jgi:hypothetical protein
MLDISARTLSTIRARTAAKAAPDAPPAEPTREEREREGMFGLARKLTGRQKQKPSTSNDDNKWEMSKLLAAVESNESRSKEFRPSTAAALGALEAALADMAVDLSSITGEAAPSNEDWRLYLAGDRGIAVCRDLCLGAAGHARGDLRVRVEVKRHCGAIANRARVSSGRRVT